MPELRVATVNMHMGVPEGMRLEPANEREAAVLDIAAFISEVDADIALVQEVRDDDPGARPGGVPQQFRLLREAAGASDSAFHATVQSGAGDHYGLCMLARKGLRFDSIRAERLPHSDDEELRIVQLAHVTVDGTPLTVANLHLDHRGTDRPKQVVELDRILRDEQTQQPVIAGGDFNDLAPAVAAGMTQSSLVNIVDGLSEDDPLRGDTHVEAGRIDHLLLSNGVELVEQRVLEVPRRQLRDGTAVTDHLALIARVRVGV